MIAYLNGIIRKKLSDSIILLIGGVGYKVNVAKNIYHQLKEDDSIELFTYTAVREDDISIYGFQTPQELEVFKMCISVSGVGPKTAMELMNTPLDILQNAIIQGKAAILSQTPGIGKKTAERIIIDLKDKMKRADIPHIDLIANDVNQDALIALQNLGFRRHQILDKLKNLPTEIKDTEQIIRYFLQNA